MIPRTAIVTDSTADIPNNIIQQFNIYVVPTVLVTGDQSILDDVNFSREEFYRLLPNMNQHPTTASPSIGAFEELYANLFKKGIEMIVSIHVSSVLSGVYNAASAAAKNSDGEIHVIDSQQLSMGLGFQVMNAAKANSNLLSISEVLQEIEQTRINTRLIAMLDTLDYVRKSGRVSWALATIGNLLRLKQFIEVKDGRVLRLGETRTRRKGFERLIEHYHQLDSVQQLAILHTNAEDDALEFLDAIKLSSDIPHYIVNITPVIGTHVGPNGVGFTAVKKY